MVRQYSPSYMRATHLITALDAGFASAMRLRPRWLRDIASFVFSLYYILRSEEADNKARRILPTYYSRRVVDVRAYSSASGKKTARSSSCVRRGTRPRTHT